MKKAFLAVVLACGVSGLFAADAPNMEACKKTFVTDGKIIYVCGDKTFVQVKNFNQDDGLYLVMPDGKKIKVAD